MGIIEFPVFYGEDLQSWILWMEDFFVKEDFNDLEKLNLAHWLIQGDALSWCYQRLDVMVFESWEMLKRALVFRFGNCDDRVIFCLENERSQKETELRSRQEKETCHQAESLGLLGGMKAVTSESIAELDSSRKEEAILQNETISHNQLIPQEGSFHHQSCGSLDSLEPSKLFAEKNPIAPDPESEIISEIDRTMKKHADNLLHVMESVSAHLTQLENRTRNLENLVDDVKVSVANSHGNTDGKMRQLENIMLEVQSGVQLLKDKQDIVEAQLQLLKLQVSKVNQQPESHSSHVEPTAQPPASLPQPQASAAASPSPSQQGLPQLQYIQPPASQHSLPQPSSQLPSQFGPQQDPYFPPPRQSQPPPATPPSYQPPPNQSLHQPPYQSPPQQSQHPQQPAPRRQQPSSGYLSEESPYPSQSYPQNPPSHPPPGSAPSRQYYNVPPTPPSMYDASGGMPSSGFPSGYSPEPYPCTGPPSQFGNTPSLKPTHPSGSGSGYPQLPMTRPLPQALPMATAISNSDSGSPRSGSRVPVDDVIDKVTSMGFPRDQVRGTVRTLTDNGQAVDLNIVLDKLMNGDRGGHMQQQQPPQGWYGGR